MACKSAAEEGLARAATIVCGVIAVVTNASEREWGMRVVEVGQDGRLAADGREAALPVTRTPRGPFVDAERRLVYFVEHELAPGVFRPALSAYRLDPSTGATTLFGRAELTQTHSYGTDAALHPGGRLLYTTGESGSGEVLGYRIDTSDGLAVDRLPVSPFTSKAAHGYPGVGGLRISPSGRFLWALASFVYKAQGLLSFRIAPGSGALELVGSLRIYDRESNLAVDGRERFAFQAAGGLALVDVRDRL
jgi:6-phosphogluconolactonase (cycloisomerase 2 family)